MAELKYVGTSATRIDGAEKVMGSAQFVDDLDFGPDLLHAEIVESPYAHALIKSINTAEAEAVPGVVKVVTLGMIPPVRKSVLSGTNPDMVILQQIWKAVNEESCLRW